MQASLKSKLEAKSENIEKVLIIVFFFSILMKYFFSDAKVIVTYTAPIALLILSIVYLILSEKIYKFLVLALLLGVMAPLLNYFPLGSYLNLGSSLAVTVFGIYVLIRAVKESLANNTFELLPFLLGFLLTIRLAVHIVINYIPDIDTDQVYNLYFFGLSFIIGTIMYNDNFWERYNLSEKKVFLFLLVVSLGNVLAVSLKYI